MKIKKILFFPLLMILALYGTLFAQEDDINEEFVLSYHSKGDQTFSIEMGLFIPMVTIDPTPGSGRAVDSLSGQMNLGGTGFLSYCGYLNSNFRIGGEFGGMFASSLNENMFYIVPLMVKTVYDININTYFTVPLYLSAGISFNSYDDLFMVDPIVKPGFGFNWNYDSEWSFITKYTVWIIPEITKADDQSRIGVFSDLRVGVEYHF